MSDFRAIGGVSATLQMLLLDRMELPDYIASAPVTVGPPPPSAEDNRPKAEDPRVNLFLYRVTENGYLQNQEIPGRGSPGAFGHPPLSLNLHYLITAYGNTKVSGEGPTAIYDDLTAHFLLGSAMRVLHDVTIITDALRTVRAPSGRIVLHESLRSEFEKVKLTLEPLTLEDVTKVWSALVLRYRVSAGYVVNVVQIESRRARTFPRPVGRPISPTTPPLPTDAPSPGPMVYVMTIQAPAIADVKVRRSGIEQPFPYARIGDTLVLLGTSLSGPVTNVEIGDVVVPASVARGDRVEVDIPDTAVPGLGAIPADLLLQPGVRTVRVIASDPFVPQSRFRSNDAAFMLVPTVGAATYTAAPTRTLTIDGQRLVSGASGGEAMIGRVAVARSAFQTATPLQIVVPVPDALPTRGVSSIVGAPLPDKVPIGPGPQELLITIGTTQRTVTPNLTTLTTRAAVAAELAALIHDALPGDTRFAGVRVDVVRDGLVIVPGGLTDTMRITSPNGSLASDLGLTAPQSPGRDSGYVSGALPRAPSFAGANPRVVLTIGAQQPITIALARAMTLGEIADDLQAKIRAAGGGPEYADAAVVTTGSQLLIVPGTADAATFSAAPGDDRALIDLQLLAQFAVRVRVNGAESLDDVAVELPK